MSKKKKETTAKKLTAIRNLSAGNLKGAGNRPKSGSATFTETPWDPNHGPDPDKANIDDVVASLKAYYRKHDAAKEAKCAAEVSPHKHRSIHPSIHSQATQHNTHPPTRFAIELNHWMNNKSCNL